MPDPDQPYLPPKSDITLPSEADAKPAIPHHIKVMMVVGIILCAGWPLFFGVQLIAHPAGGPALLATVLVLSVATWTGFSVHPPRFRALALGLLILGLLSLFPFLPLMLGGMLIFLFDRLPKAGATTPGMTPLAAALVTIFYAATYILSALGLGVIIQAFRDPDSPSRRRKKPPAI